MTRKFIMVTGLLLAILATAGIIIYNLETFVSLTIKKFVELQFDRFIKLICC